MVADDLETWRSARRPISGLWQAMTRPWEVVSFFLHWEVIIIMPFGGRHVICHRAIGPPIARLWSIVGGPGGDTPAEPFLGAAVVLLPPFHDGILGHRSGHFILQRPRRPLGTPPVAPGVARKGQRRNVNWKWSRPSYYGDLVLIEEKKWKVAARKKKSI